MNYAMRAIWLVLLTALMATQVDAQQLYKWVDKDGKISYSDTPPPKDAKDVRQKGYGDNVKPSDELPYSVKEAVKRNPVTLYANACENCSKARAMLSERGIPYTERNPEADAAASDALKEAAGALLVPTLTIGQRVIKGFAESEWHDALTNSGYPRTYPGILQKTPAPSTAAPAASTPAPTK